MTGLIEKLEAAEVGSRALDWAIAEMFGDVPEHEVRKIGMGYGWNREPGRFALYRPKDSEGRSVEMWQAPQVTTSLDAALALAERMGLDGWNALYAAMMSWKAHDPRGPLSRSLPLSLCAAILRALNLNEIRHAE